MYGSIKLIQEKQEVRKCTEKHLTGKEKVK